MMHIFEKSSILLYHSIDINRVSALDMPHEALNVPIFTDLIKLIWLVNL